MQRGKSRGAAATVRGVGSATNRHGLARGRGSWEAASLPHLAMMIAAMREGFVH